MKNPFEEGVTTVGKLKEWLSRWDDSVVIVASHNAEMCDISIEETELYENKDGQLVWWNGYEGEPEHPIKGFSFDTDHF